METGDYSLGIRLLDMDSEMALADWVLGQVQVVGRTRDFEVPPMRYQLQADFAGQVTLLGYDLDLSPVGAGESARLTLYWQAQREVETAYNVFVHLLNESQNIVIQVDQEPRRGEAPTTGWLTGEVVTDEFEITVPEEMATVRSIAVGLYDPSTGERVPVLNAEGISVGDNVMFPVP
jgi:hypothetical protein